MKETQKGSVNYNDYRYYCEVDDHGYIWLLLDSGKTNYGQFAPLKESDNIEEVVKKMLYCAGY